MALARGEVGGLRDEVEFETEGARARAREVGEGDDEVLRVGAVGVEGDAEAEGDLGGAGSQADAAGWGAGGAEGAAA